MKTHHFVIAAGVALFGFTGFAIAGLATMPAPQTLAKGDRLDVIEQAQRCTGMSMMAACADDDAADASASNGFVQVFEKPGQTILVRTQFGG